ncbi:fimbrial protein [Kosakonia sp. H7A]|uniref:fimbrial protein n=1 Tax=Kosakonia sp. H7A TaxID=2054598 RepID=UPI0011B27A47|nr:type 1 fimbrial protein [Kosakonia sp. H7A]
MKKIIALSALMAALASANAMAVDANVTFTGSVTSSTCTMNASDASKSLTVPDISAAALTAQGTAWGNATATTNITFTSCPASVSALKVASITSTGTQYTSGTNSNYRYTPASGSATGFYTVIGLGTNKLAQPADGSVLSWSVAPTSGTAVVPVTVGPQAYTAVVSSAAAPTAGNYSTSYTLTFAWS